MTIATATATIPAAKPTDRQNGTVKSFNVEKGFGYITPEAGGQDVYVHFTAIMSEGYRQLSVDQLVTFDVVRGAQGLTADNVLRVGER